jgi:AraC family transcriptional activator of pobA
MKTIETIEGKKVHRVKLDTFVYSKEKATYQDGDVVIYDDIRNLAQIYTVDDNSEAIVPEFNIIVCCMQGRLMLNVNGTPNMIESGQVAICPPNYKLSDYMLSPDFQCMIFCFTTHILQESLRGYIHLWNKGVYVNKVSKIELEEADGQLIKCYYELLRCKIGHPTTIFYKRIMHSMIQAVLFEICGRITEDEEGDKVQGMSQGKDLFRRFLELLQSTEVKKHSVEHYAATLNVTAKYLSVVCKRESGKTALAWVQEYILEDIRFYLSDPTLSIKEIADMTGFSNLSFFGRFVCQHFGCSPREYRARLAEEQNKNYVNTEQE